MGIIGKYGAGEWGVPHEHDICCACKSVPAQIVMVGYTNGQTETVVCRKCALQLSRKLLEDVCDLEGDRNG